MIKKKWDKPKLIILVRQRSAENILAACKQYGYQDLPDATFSGCGVADWSWDDCLGNCNSPVGS